MKAYKCDRCGEPYALKPDFRNVRFNGANIHLRSIWFIKEETDYIVPNLCYKCFNSFIEWWNEPSLETIAN